MITSQIFGKCLDIKHKSKLHVIPVTDWYQLIFTKYIIYIYCYYNIKNIQLTDEQVIKVCEAIYTDNYSFPTQDMHMVIKWNLYT